MTGAREIHPFHSIPLHIHIHIHIHIHDVFRGVGNERASSSGVKGTDIIAAIG